MNWKFWKRKKEKEVSKPEKKVISKDKKKVISKNKRWRYAEDGITKIPVED